MNLVARDFTMVYFSLRSSTFYHSSCTRPEKFYTREHMFTEIPSPLFFLSFFPSFFFPRRPRGIDRYIFELAPVCVFNRHTRLLNFIGVVHSRARVAVFIDAVFCLFSMHIYTRKYSNSKCCKP